MKWNDMVYADHEPGDPPLITDTNWDAVDALSEEEVHTAALADPDALPIPRGSDQRLAQQGLMHVVNVKKLRERLGLTQEVFATTYRIPLGTLRDWEQRRKFPDAPARAYLTVIARNPPAVAKMLGEAA